MNTEWCDCCRVPSNRCACRTIHQGEPYREFGSGGWLGVLRLPELPDVPKVAVVLDRVTRERDVRTYERDITRLRETLCNHLALRCGECTTAAANDITVHAGLSLLDSRLSFFVASFDGDLRVVIAFNEKVRMRDFRSCLSFAHRIRDEILEERDEGRPSYLRACLFLGRDYKVRGVRKESDGRLTFVTNQLFGPRGHLARAARFWRHELVYHLSDVVEADTQLIAKALAACGIPDPLVDKEESLKKARHMLPSLLVGKPKGSYIEDKEVHDRMLRQLIDKGPGDRGVLPEYAIPNPLMGNSSESLEWARDILRALLVRKRKGSYLELRELEDRTLQSALADLGAGRDPFPARHPLFARKRVQNAFARARGWLLNRR